MSNISCWIFQVELRSQELLMGRSLRQALPTHSGGGANPNPNLPPFPPPPLYLRETQESLFAGYMGLHENHMILK